MKVIAVYGSPNKNGISARYVSEMVRGAADAGHEVSSFYIGSGDLRGCVACRCCKTDYGTATECVIDDILKPYWSELKQADVLIIGIPNYMGGVAAQLSAFLNRHFSMHEQVRGASRIPEGIKLIGVFAQGMPVKSTYVDVYNRYLDTFRGWKMEPAEPFVVSQSDGEETLTLAYEIGRALK